MKDERLELLSDKVRKGQPVDIGEALEVIEYQKQLKATQPQPLLKQFLNWCRTITGIGIS